MRIIDRLRNGVNRVAESMDSGRSLQSVREGGEPERLARPADWNRGWEEICF